MRRRKLLGAAASLLGATALAGCSGQIEGSEPAADVAYPPQSVGKGQWESIKRSTLPIEEPGLSGVAAIRTYRNPAVQQKLADRFAGQFDQPLTMAYAARLHYNGSASSLVTQDKLMERVKTRFIDQLRSQQLEGLRELPPAEWKDDGQPAPELGLIGPAYTEYRATYPIEKRTETFDIDGYGPQELTFERQQIPMRVLLLVSDSLGVTSGEAHVLGGAYPTENYHSESTTRLAESGEAKMDLTVQLDAGISPTELRTDLVEGFINSRLEDAQ